MANRGYITLISTIIISVILLLAVTALGERAIIGRFMLIDIERKIQSHKLAEACVQVAIIAISNDPAYNQVAPMTVPVGDNDCVIESVVPSGGSSHIITSASVGGAISNLEFVWDILGEKVSSWQELANLP